MTVRSLVTMVLTVLLATVGGRPAGAGTVVADLSRHLIPITTAFGGSDVLLFGTTEEADDVIVVVRGPPEPVLVRRKSRIGLIWLNRAAVRFEAVPAFYAVAATRPPAELLGPQTLLRHQIGFASLDVTASGLDDAALAAFRDGLLRNKQRAQLYVEDLRVRFVGQRLFRTSITFPANVPPGRYQVEVFAIRDGRIVAAQQSALVVSKVGVEAQLSDVAHEQRRLYAVAAIAFAVAAGWLAALAFRRT